ncbi:unnamed protein product [Acanthoscelides obtectus]|uniref:Uncharacterized protein n=1 Tax=Acanthoscelides obtectus TaxID=200917 RepID=A0A9P0LE82_ACAOB|nr:unnamed protein product [Acanthoscelides obtectus]CAK1636431.1 hypothetical protein AOBTE_LOCUS9847 [Acanthoscelides obtectus]
MKQLNLIGMPKVETILIWRETKPKIALGTKDCCKSIGTVPASTFCTVSWPMTYAIFLGGDIRSRQYRV